MERDWNSWDDTPQTVQEHIEHYRTRLVQPKAVESDEPSVDFFQASFKILFVHLTKKFNKIVFNFDIL